MPLSLPDFVSSLLLSLASPISRVWISVNSQLLSVSQLLETSPHCLHLQDRNRKFQKNQTTNPISAPYLTSCHDPQLQFKISGWPNFSLKIASLASLLGRSPYWRTSLRRLRQSSSIVVDISIMEMSHKGKEFVSILKSTLLWKIQKEQQNSIITCIFWLFSI